MGAFCSHGKQTKSQITIILAIFKPPYQSNIYTKLGTNSISGFRGVVVWKCKRKDRRTHGRTMDKKWSLSLRWAKKKTRTIC